MFLQYLESKTSCQGRQSYNISTTCTHCTHTVLCWTEVTKHRSCTNLVFLIFNITIDNNFHTVTVTMPMFVLCTRFAVVSHRCIAWLSLSFSPDAAAALWVRRRGREGYAVNPNAGWIWQPNWGTQVSLSLINKETANQYSIYWFAILTA